MNKTIGQRLQARVETDSAETLYSHFEPWDVEERPDWVMEQAVKDDVDLYRNDYVKTNNIAPHPFQTGFLLSTHKTRASVAGSRTGKSYPIFIEIGCMCSGEFPISMQYNKGVDTGVKRTKSFLNVQRWGRRDLKTGEIIDYDTSYPDDGTWDCGTIIGAGKYPQEKVIPESLDGFKEDRTIWVGTTATAMDESWWPKLTEDGARVLPEKFIDKTKGNNGANSTNHVIYLKNDIRLSIISYESGHRKFEAITAWACFFDEEPPDRRCVSAAMSHSRYFSLTMTPLLGMSYTKDLIFKKQHPSKIVFQANTYDSPYISEETIEEWRSDFPDDEIGARVWGDHTAEAATPYYARKKIRKWINQFFDVEYGYPAIMEPSEECFGLYKRPETRLPGFMDVKISLIPLDEYDEDEDQDKYPCVWRVYEDRKDGAAYFITADCANGADLPEDVGDMESALVLRRPMPELMESKPVIVAEMVTTVKPDRFAEQVAMALNYYNFALLCAEAGSRGAANGMFYSEMKTYNYWYMRQMINQRSKKQLEKKGFDTNAATRKPLFDEVQAWISQYEEDEFPDIPSEKILTMAAECIRKIVNNKIRPDHPTGKNNDLLVCFGIALWIWKTFPEQIKCRRENNEEAIDPKGREMVRRLMRAAGERDSSEVNNGFFPQHKGRTR